MERLRKVGAALVYRCAKQRSEPGSDKRGAKLDEPTLTPLELIDRIVAMVQPPRTHRHSYFGVLAPNSALGTEAMALAGPAKQIVAQTEPPSTGEGAPGVTPLGHAIPPTPELAPPKRLKAHYLWAVLIARIYEVFPLLCMPTVRWTDAPDRIRHRGHADQTDSGSYWCRLAATTHIPGARATAVG